MTAPASLPPLKVRYLSDVHLEFTGYDPPVLPSIGEDVVVLAGDMGVGTRGIEWAIRAIRDRPVLYVLGNHEFYRNDFVTLRDEARAAAAFSHVQLLEQDHVDIGGVRFLGALWLGIHGAQGAPQSPREKSQYTARLEIKMTLVQSTLWRERSVHEYQHRRNSV